MAAERPFDYHDWVTRQTAPPNSSTDPALIPMQATLAVIITVLDQQLRPSRLLLRHLAERCLPEVYRDLLMSECLFPRSARVHRSVAASIAPSPLFPSSKRASRCPKYVAQLSVSCARSMLDTTAAARSVSCETRVLAKSLSRHLDGADAISAAPHFSDGSHSGDDADADPVFHFNVRRGPGDHHCRLANPSRAGGRLFVYVRGN